MKKLFLILIFLISAIAVSANEDWLYTSEELSIDLQISADINIVPLSSSNDLKYVESYLYFFPKTDSRQDVIKLVTYPESKEQDDSLFFRWNAPENNDLSIVLDAEVITTNEPQKIKRKILFPLKNLDEDLKKYTRPTNNIDSDTQEIINLASILVEGEDDLFDATFIIAEWIKQEVDYDLSTLTAEVSQKASWVLRNKQGVCDELTTLFIAMLRSLGIPAKYVGGVAYTNYEDINGFGPHAWAEVYFPDYGWIPFDVTYGEFGYIDGSHIKLKDFLDPDESSTKYEWKGRNIDIETTKLRIDAGLSEATGVIYPYIELNSLALKEEVGFGSYNLVEIEVENIKNYYVATELTISRSKELTTIGKETKPLLLKPREKKKVFWIIKVDRDLDKKFVYTFKVAVKSLRGIETEVEFKSSDENKIYSVEEINKIKEQINNEDKKVYSRNVDLNCSIKKDKYFTGEQADINCLIENTGNVMLKDIKICLQNTCENLDLGISQEKNTYFLINTTDVGKNELKIIASNSYVSKAYYVNFEVLDTPSIVIDNLEFPERVSFGEEFNVEFRLSKKSRNEPKDVIVTLIQDNYDKRWELNKLNASQDFVVVMNGNGLSTGINNFNVIVTYSDDEKNNYEVKRKFSIALNKVNFLQRIFIFLNDLGKWFFSIGN